MSTCRHCAWEGPVMYHGQNDCDARQANPDLRNFYCAQCGSGVDEWTSLGPGEPDTFQAEVDEHLRYHSEGES